MEDNYTNVPEDVGSSISSILPSYQSQQNQEIDSVESADAETSMQRTGQPPVHEVMDGLELLTSAMNKVLGGENNTVIPFLNSPGVLGKLADTIDHFTNHMSAIERLEAEQLTVAEIKEERVAKINMLNQGFDNTVTSIIDTLAFTSKKMHDASTTLSTIAHSTGEKVLQVSKSVLIATENTGSVAETAEQLSSSIEKISQQVEKSSKISTNAVTQVQITDDAIKELLISVENIESVIKIISDIAIRTDLLALNATLESARAGTAGRGFKVVANEVKSLARQTTKATDTITEYIEEMQNASKNAVKAIANISMTVAEIDDISRNSAIDILKQDQATKEIKEKIVLVANGTSSINTSIGAVTSDVARTDTATNEMLNAADDLQHQTETLRNKVRNYLDEAKSIQSDNLGIKV